MHAIAIRTMTLSLALCAATAVGATPIPEPDVVLYGGIILNGLPVPPEPTTTIVVIAVQQGGDPAVEQERLATYTICGCPPPPLLFCDNCVNPNALIDVNGDQLNDAAYVLRLRMEFLPMGTVQSAGAVIVGDVVDLYVEDQPAAPLLMGSYTISGRGTVSLLHLPVAGGTCLGDVDGDGSVGIIDFLALLAAWGPNPGHPADLDGDDMVGITDFLALLAAWGPCP